MNVAMTLDEFDAAYREHFAYIRNVCARVVGWDRSEDLAQEAFYRAFRSLTGFKGDCAVRTWLHRIAYHEAINWVRNNSRLEFRPNQDLDRRHAHVFSAERELMLRDALKVFYELPARQQFIFNLRYHDGMKLGDIARIMGIHQSDVTRGLDRIRAEMTQVLDAGMLDDCA